MDVDMDRCLALAEAFQKGVNCDVCGCNVVVLNPFTEHLRVVDADIFDTPTAGFTARCRACQ